MIKISEIVINDIKVLAHSETVLVVDVSPYNKYENGERTEQIAGYKYTVVAHRNKYQSFIIRTEEVAPSILEEVIEKADNGILAAPVGFTAKFYRNNTGEYLLSAKAEKFVIQKEAQ